MKYILRHFPIILLTAFVALLGALNYDGGTLLTGGDNLHPEFNFALNIKRSLFAVWQEYQGVGLLGGMGHAADLLRQLFLLPFSLVIPMEALRYFWTYLTLLIGAIGAYYLIRTLLQRDVTPVDNHLRASHDEKTVLAATSTTAFSLVGSLFYLLNLATVQAYYTPFEVFMAHFAALPWLLLTTYLYCIKPTGRNLFFLILTLILSTPQGYVPTLFVVYLLAATVIAISSHPVLKTLDWAKHTGLRLLKLYTIIFVINAFWLLPFAYFTLTSADVNVNAKINQMATEMIFQQNKEVGNITDVMLLKGFWFNNVEPNLNGDSTYMLLPWRDHLANPYVLGIGYLFFAVVLFGVITTFLKKKSRVLMGFGVLFLLTVLMLTTATPPFSWINTGLREFVPLFNQVFRFPFTKFSLLAGLTYALFFTIGLANLLPYLKRFSWSRAIVTPLAAILLLIFSWPLFQGHMFYEKETITLPEAYEDTFAFFSEQDPHTRIANFPQHTYWGWNFYSWGYSGSGFLWYGIEQPILDRAFDVWNPLAENYYFEISQALYAKDNEALLAVLQKYDVTWILVDKNIIYPTSPKSLFYNELDEIIENTPEISKVEDFGNVEIYKVQLPSPSTSFVKVASNLPSVNSYTWNNYDQAYQDFGTYAALENDPTYFYPFRSFFSQKTEKQQEFTLKEEDTSLVFQAALPPSRDERIVKVPSIAETEKIYPATIATEKATGGAVLVTATIASPEVWLGDKRITGEEAKINLFTIPATTTFPLTLRNNGLVNIKITNESKEITTTFISLKQDNVFTLTDSNGRIVNSAPVPSSVFAGLENLKEKEVILPTSDSTQQLRVIIPKITDNYANFTPSLGSQPTVFNCDYFRPGTFSAQSIKGETTSFVELTATNATACISYYAPTLSHDYGYAIFLKHKNTNGRDLHFWVLNENQGYSPLDTYVPADDTERTSTFVLPPQEQFGTAYSLHFDSISIGSDLTHNSISHLSVHPIPYTLLSALRIEKTQATVSEQRYSDITVTHPNESLYTVTGLSSQDNQTLILSQSFDKGWKAYHIQQGAENQGLKRAVTTAFPFVTGSVLKDHVQINTWANGWNLSGFEISTDDQIIIVYLPQYLQYLGFILPMIILVFFGAKKVLVSLKKRA